MSVTNCTASSGLKVLKISWIWSFDFTNSVSQSPVSCKSWIVSRSLWTRSASAVKLALNWRDWSSLTLASKRLTRSMHFPKRVSISFALPGLDHKLAVVTCLRASTMAAPFSHRFWLPRSLLTAEGAGVEGALGAVSAAEAVAGVVAAMEGVSAGFALAFGRALCLGFFFWQNPNPSDSELESLELTELDESDSALFFASAFWNASSTASCRLDCLPSNPTILEFLLAISF